MRLGLLAALLGAAACHPVRSYDIGHVLDDVVPDRLWWVTPLRVWAPYPAPVRENRP